METYIYLGAALLALLASLPALAHKEHWNAIREFWGGGLRNALWDLAASDMGVIVVTYCTPRNTPGIVPPTGAQAAQVIEQSAQIFWADADTSAVFTHNWGLAPSCATFLLPQVLITKALGAAGDTFSSLFTFGLTNTNAVVLNKVSGGVGSGGTYNVWLRKGINCP